MTARQFTETSKLTVPILLALNAVAGAAAGGAAAATWYYTTREGERTWVRQEIKIHAQEASREESLIFLTREEAGRIREGDREKLEAKLDTIKDKLERLTVAVERLGGRR